MFHFKTIAMQRQIDINDTVTPRVEEAELLLKDVQTLCKESNVEVFVQCDALKHLNDTLENDIQLNRHFSCVPHFVLSGAPDIKLGTITDAKSLAVKTGNVK